MNALSKRPSNEENKSKFEMLEGKIKMTPHFSNVICNFFFFWVEKTEIFYRIWELKTQQKQLNLSLVGHVPPKLIKE